MQRVASIDKGLDVVEAIQAAGENGLGVRALGRALGINPTTTHNICQTLAARGYLIQDPSSRRFRLGASWLPLARQGDIWRGLADAADGLVHRCREELDESIMLAVLDRATIATLVYYPSSQALRVDEPRVMGACLCDGGGKTTAGQLAERSPGSLSRKLSCGGFHRLNHHRTRRVCTGASSFAGPGIRAHPR